VELDAQLLSVGDNAQVALGFEIVVVKRDRVAALGLGESLHCDGSAQSGVDINLLQRRMPAVAADDEGDLPRADGSGGSAKTGSAFVLVVRGAAKTGSEGAAAACFRAGFLAGTGDLRVAKIFNFPCCR
jgi:hypothetical protein